MLILVAAAVAGCGGAPRTTEFHRRPPAPSTVGAPAAGTSAVVAPGPLGRHRHHVVRATPLALVTAETENRVLAVDMASGSPSATATW